MCLHTASRVYSIVLLYIVGQLSRLMSNSARVRDKMCALLLLCKGYLVNRYTMRKTNVKTGHWAEGFTGRGSEPPPPLARRYTFSVLQAQAAPVLIPDILLWLNNCTTDTHQTSEASLCHEDWGPEGEAQIFSQSPLKPKY